MMSDLEPTCSIANGYYGIKIIIIDLICLSSGAVVAKFTTTESLSNLLILNMLILPRKNGH